MASPQPPSWTAPPPRPHHPDEPAGAASTPAAGTAVKAADAHEHTRLALVIALSIALVSVLGAVVGWRAEVHASAASRYEQDAVATSIALSQAQGEAAAAAATADSRYAHYVKLGDEADELVPNACQGGNVPADLAGLDARALCDTQLEFSGYANIGYQDGKGNFDMKAFANDYMAAQKEQAQLDPHEYEAVAANEHHHEDKMLYLSLFLVLALALLTLARLGKSVPSRLMLAVPGWLAMVGSAAFLIATEL